MAKQKEKLIDFHTHIYPNAIADKAVDSVSRFYDIPILGNGLLEDMEKGASNFDVRAFVVLMVATSPRQVESINNFGKGIISNKVFVYGSLHPQYENNIQEIDRMLDFGFSGVKMHPDFQQFNIDDPSLFPIYAKLEEKGLPILMHMGDERYEFSRPQRLAKVLDHFPSLKVVAAHMGGYTRWDEVRKYLVGRNVMFDTSSTLWSLGPQGCRQLIMEHGCDKIIFGSDYPVMSVNKEMELFDQMELPQEIRSKILFENATSFLFANHRNDGE